MKKIIFLIWFITLNINIIFCSNNTNEIKDSLYSDNSEKIENTNKTNTNNYKDSIKQQKSEIKHIQIDSSNNSISKFDEFIFNNKAPSSSNKNISKNTLEKINNGVKNKNNKKNNDEYIINNNSNLVFIQVGSFREYPNAEKNKAIISNKIDLKNYQIMIKELNGYYKLLIGPFNSRENAEKYLRYIKSKGIDGFIFTLKK